MTVRIIALPTDQRHEVGLDLPGAATTALAEAGVELRPGDVLVVASKLVALAEGRLVEVGDADPHATRRALARREAHRVVADDPRVLVVQTHHGLVSANGGIDTSNVPPGRALLLPRDPDASARRLRGELAARTGTSVGVVVTDTFGRPWRQGQVDVAIGAAGIAVVRDERTGHDLWGRQLEVTVAAIADEIASAADLVRGKDTGVGFVVVRGLDVAGEGAATDLVRPAEDDLFRAGGATMADHVVARGGPDVAPGDDEPASHLRAMVELATGEGVVVVIADEAPRPDVLRVELVVGPADPADPGRGDDEAAPARHPDPEGLVALGGVLARLELMARARGWGFATSRVRDRRVHVDLDPTGAHTGTPTGDDRAWQGQSSTTNSR